MSSCIVDIPATVSVGMGQIALGHKAGRLTAVLGSCIGLVLSHPRLQVAALAHIVLPQSSGREGLPGKFADTAVPAMLRQLEQHGAPRSGLVAKMAGGACMFGNGGPMQIGDSNAAAVIEALRQHGIALAAHDVGGKTGRRVSIDCANGCVTVEAVGKPARTL